MKQEETNCDDILIKINMLRVCLEDMKKREVCVHKRRVDIRWKQLNYVYLFLGG